ncbi:MAG: hypothetical protein AMXMBFR33_57830 [Candidatus Xenobia bacterium]
MTTNDTFDELAGRIKELIDDCDLAVTNRTGGALPELAGFYNDFLSRAQSICSAVARDSLLKEFAAEALTGDLADHVQALRARANQLLTVLYRHTPY